jgi:putative phosphotransacetylase
VALTISRAAVESVVRDVVTRRLTGGTGVNGKTRSGPPLRVDASARHMHLCREDIDALFGKGYELTEFRPLYQPGNFAANEMVTLIGPRSRVISNLRILGPLRPQSQIELAYTDIISLGLEDVPVRLSGNIAGSPGGWVMGPKGMIQLKEGIIRAAIHVHMNPEDAEFYGVKQGDLMKLRVGGDASVTFEKVHVRIDKTVLLNVHMDTDEANACGLHMAKDIELFR